MTLSRKYLIVIAGPTAVGKTAAAIAVARHFKTGIISADSRQFFKEMSIGTAKPTAAERRKAKHYFVGHLSVKDNYDAGKFEQDVMKLLPELFADHDLVVMAGGSGMYINAVCNGFDALPESDPHLREELQSILKEKGIQVLRDLLMELDPKYYYMVDLNNPQRLVRALEVCISSGRPFSSFRKGEGKKRDFEIVKIGLNTERDELYSRINERVDQMMKKGLLKEVKGLEKYRSWNALQTVGYKELFDHLDGKCSLQEAVEKIKQNTRNFAKRQLTWFRKDKEMKWFRPDEVKEMIAYIQSVCVN